MSDILTILPSVKKSFLDKTVLFLHLEIISSLLYQKKIHKIFPELCNFLMYSFISKTTIFKLDFVVCCFTFEKSINFHWMSHTIITFLSQNLPRGFAVFFISFSSCISNSPSFLHTGTVVKKKFPDQYLLISQASIFCNNKKLSTTRNPNLFPPFHSISFQSVLYNSQVR